LVTGLHDWAFLLIITHHTMCVVEVVSAAIQVPEHHHTSKRIIRTRAEHSNKATYKGKL
jgi:hypothetical protein